ncbi:MAG: BolA family protein [Asticcacaulis sp.]
MGKIAQSLTEKLTLAFNPTHLEVIDDSDRHAGHAGARPGGESHFTVRMTAEQFAGLTRLQRQRAVNTVLAEELAGPVHALSLVLNTPDANEK